MRTILTCVLLDCEKKQPNKRPRTCSYQIISTLNNILFLDHSATGPELGVSANDLPARRVNGPLPSTGNHTGANPPRSGFPGISPELKQIPRVEESHLMTKYPHFLFLTLRE